MKSDPPNEAELIPLNEAQATLLRLWLEGWLREHQGWHTSPRLCEASGHRLSDRTLRLLASQSDQIISSAQGFKHLSHATPDEVRHFLNDLLSRAKALAKRYGRVRRAAHKIIG